MINVFVKHCESVCIQIKTQCQMSASDKFFAQINFIKPYASHLLYFLLQWSFWEIVNKCITIFFFQWQALSHRPWPTTEARSGDHFIMEAPDRRSPLTPIKGRTVITSMPYPGFEPGTFGVTFGSPTHYTSWSATSVMWSSRSFLLCNATIM